MDGLLSGRGIASPLAVEGLDVVDGEHLFLAETDQSFCDVIVQLLTNPDRHPAPAVRGRAWRTLNVS